MTSPVKISLIIVTLISAVSAYFGAIRIPLQIAGLKWEKENAQSRIVELEKTNKAVEKEKNGVNLESQALKWKIEEGRQKLAALTSEKEVMKTETEALKNKEEALLLAIEAKQNLLERVFLEHEEHKKFGDWLKSEMALLQKSEKKVKQELFQVKRELIATKEAYDFVLRNNPRLSEAVILNVDEKLGFAVINRGLDAKLNAGDEMIIKRKNIEIGRMKIRIVLENTSIADFVKTEKKAGAKAGDLAYPLLLAAGIEAEYQRRFALRQPLVREEPQVDEDLVAEAVAAAKAVVAAVAAAALPRQPIIESGQSPSSEERKILNPKLRLRRGEE